MPSKSKSQQRLMGVAYAVKSGDMQLSDVDANYRDKVKDLVDGMSLKDLKDFAETKHDGLPEVKENITLGNIGGMGPIQFPTETELGSGDVPAGKKSDEDEEDEKQLKETMKGLITSFESFIQEARDMNDPILMKLRADQMKRAAKKNEPIQNQLSPAKAKKLAKLEAERAEIMRDMEQEAEMEGGPIADRYGDMLNKIDKQIAKLQESVLNEDWGSSDQAAMNQSIHQQLGKPKKFMSPFDSKLRAAAEDAVDWYWDEWPEYKRDRAGLIDNAVRSYMRAFFPKEFAAMVRMFEPVDEAYDGNMSDFKYEFPQTFVEVTSNPEKAIKKIAKKGKNGYEVRTSIYMSEPEMKAVGDAMGLELVSYEKSSNIAISVYESVKAINEDWGTYDTPEGKKVAKELDKAWNTFAKTVNAAHNEWLKTVQKYRGDAGQGSGFRDSEGRDAVISAMEWYLGKVFMVDNRFGGIDGRKYRPLMGESIEIEEIDEARAVKRFDKKLIDDKFQVHQEGALRTIYKGVTGNVDMEVSEKWIEMKGLRKLPEDYRGQHLGRFYELKKNLYLWATDMKSAQTGRPARDSRGNAFFNIMAIFTMDGDEILTLWERPSNFQVGTHGGPGVGFQYESVEIEDIDEARSINKIQKDWGKIVDDMRATVATWKEAEGKDKEDLLAKLKDLTAQKKKLEAELNDAVGLKDADAELAESLNESINFGDYVFTSRMAFNSFDEALPAKGETVYCVFLHNYVEVNGSGIYFGDNGGGLRPQILGLFTEEADAREMYNNAVKSKKDGNMLSVSMGTLTSKSKFQFNYKETDGYRAKGMVK